MCLTLDYRITLKYVSNQKLSMPMMLTSLAWLQRLEKCAVSTLAEWFFRVNQEKTEYVHLFRGKDRIQEEWRKAKKLGSLLGVDEDIARRKQLATVAFNSMWPLWKRREKVPEALHLRLYNAFILPILSYNAGTWGASSTAIQRLDSFHRKQLWKIIGVIWPQKIRNDVLYRKCNTRPLSTTIRQARWRLFGHILRLPRDAPAQIAADHYFKNDGPSWRRRPQCTLPTILKDDLKNTGIELNCGSGLAKLRATASCRQKWRNLVGIVCSGSWVTVFVASVFSFL